MEAFLIFLQKSPVNMVLFGGAVCSGLLLLWPFIMRPFRAGREVSVIEAVQLINRRDATVLDIRDTGDFEAGHLRGAKHIPEMQVTERLQELAKLKDRPLIVVCQSGTRASVVVSALQRQGYAEAVALEGGIAGWKQAVMPVQKS